jgi:hypothetical protein
MSLVRVPRTFADESSFAFPITTVEAGALVASPSHGGRAARRTSARGRRTLSRELTRRFRGAGATTRAFVPFAMPNR